jgi:hypothetical protein
MTKERALTKSKTLIFAGKPISSQEKWAFVFWMEIFGGGVRGDLDFGRVSPAFLVVCFCL